MQAYDCAEVQPRGALVPLGIALITIVQPWVTLRRAGCLQVFDRVEVQPRDAREASDVFYKQGKGDALLTYENEAVFTNLVVSPNEKLPCIVPDNNVRVRLASWPGLGR